MDVPYQSRTGAKEKPDSLISPGAFGVYQLQLAAVRPEMFLMHICCDICSGILRNPVVLKKCGHYFCHSCLVFGMQRGMGACSVCCESFSGHNCFVADSALKAFIESLFPYFVKYEKLFTERFLASREQSPDCSAAKRGAGAPMRVERILDAHQKFDLYQRFVGNCELVQVHLENLSYNEPGFLAKLEKGKFVVANANSAVELVHEYVRQLVGDDSKKVDLHVNNIELMLEEPWEHVLRRLGVGKDEVATALPVTILIN